MPLTRAPKCLLIECGNSNSSLPKMTRSDFAHHQTATLSPKQTTFWFQAFWKQESHCHRTIVALIVDLSNSTVRQLLADLDWLDFAFHGKHGKHHYSGEYWQSRVNCLIGVSILIRQRKNRSAFWIESYEPAEERCRYSFWWAEGFNCRTFEILAREHPDICLALQADPHWVKEIFLENFRRVALPEVQEKTKIFEQSLITNLSFQNDVFLTRVTSNGLERNALFRCFIWVPD